MTTTPSPAVRPHRLAHRSAGANLAMMGIGALVVLLACLGILFVVPAYLPVLRGFGLELPNLTRWIVDYHAWLLLLVFVPPALWAAWPNPARSGLAALIAGGILGPGLFTLTMLALHLPFIRLAALAP